MLRLSNFAAKFVEFRTIASINTVFHAFRSDQGEARSMRGLKRKLNDTEAASGVLPVIAHLSQQLSALKENQADMNKQIADLKENEADMNKQIADLKENEADMNKQIADLKSEVQARRRPPIDMQNVDRVALLANNMEDAVRDHDNAIRQLWEYLRSTSPTFEAPIPLPPFDEDVFINSGGAIWTQSAAERTPPRPTTIEEPHHPQENLVRTRPPSS